MSIISMKSLLESGVHFGHQKRKWHPKMASYIFTDRNGIHIIDLQKTVQKTREAYEAMREYSSEGKEILFVGTKKQAKATVEEEAKRCKMHYVTNRWLGGCLTNWNTIKKSISRLKKLEQMFEDDTVSQEASTKKEVLHLKKECEKKQKIFGGIKNLVSPPDILFVVDISKEEIAVKEAKKLGLIIFGIVDTNSNPELVDYPIPGNDDAIRSIGLFLNTISSAIIEGQGGDVDRPDFNEDIESQEKLSMEYRGEYDETGSFILDQDIAQTKQEKVDVEEDIPSKEDVTEYKEE